MLGSEDQHDQNKKINKLKIIVIILSSTGDHPKSHFLQKIIVLNLLIEILHIFILII